jgi:hypothetical protein
MIHHTAEYSVPVALECIDLFEKSHAPIEASLRPDQEKLLLTKLYLLTCLNDQDDSYSLNQVQELINQLPTTLIESEQPFQSALVWCHNAGNTLEKGRYWRIQRRMVRIATVVQTLH